MTHPLPLRHPGFQPLTTGQEKLWALLREEANRTLTPLQLCQRAGYQTTGPWYAALKDEAFRRQVEALGVLIYVYSYPSTQSTCQRQTSH